MTSDLAIYYVDGHKAKLTTIVGSILGLFDPMASLYWLALKGRVAEAPPATTQVLGQFRDQQGQTK